MEHNFLNKVIEASPYFFIFQISFAAFVLLINTFVPLEPLRILVDLGSKNILAPGIFNSEAISNVLALYVLKAIKVL